MPQVSPAIFKAYDIRGIAGQDIDGDVAELIGRAFAHVLAQLSGKPVGELREAAREDYRWSYAGERRLRGIRDSVALFRARRRSAAPQ